MAHLKELAASLKCRMLVAHSSAHGVTPSGNEHD